MRTLLFAFFAFFIAPLLLPTHSEAIYAHTNPATSNLDPAIACIITPDEKVLWVGTPSLKPLLLQIAFPILLIPIEFIIYKFFSQNMSQEKKNQFIGVSVVLPLILGGSVFMKLLKVWHVNYAITNKRVIIKKGLWSSTTMFFEFKKIESIKVKEGIFEKLFGIASIYIHNGETKTYDVRQENKTNKKIKKRHGNQMIEDEIHEEKGPDIIRQKTRKVYYILKSIPDYANVYQILERAKQASKGKS